MTNPLPGSFFNATIVLLLSPIFAASSAAQYAESARPQAAGPVQKIYLDSSPRPTEIPPTMLPPVQKITIDPRRDQVAIGHVDGLADFRDSPLSVPDAFGLMEQVREIPKEGDKTKNGAGSPIVPTQQGFSSFPYAMPFPVQQIQVAPFPVQQVLAAPQGFSGFPFAPMTYGMPNTGTTERQNTVTAVFENAAHFGIHQNSDCLGGLPDKNVVIYEGMTVRVSPNGAYEVRFIAESPDVPAVIQLQLSVQERGVNLGKVTLPPIVLRDADYSSRSRSQGRLPNQTRSWLVRRSGYSHFLNGITGDERHRLSVTRSGTVQLGQIPERMATY
ncbi:MAG TPA: hypothetical protein PLY87_18865 [Planctomycetaceae bacterium]|nr:hypothetical protein [Planctomycetaceae bacterium]